MEVGHFVGVPGGVGGVRRVLDVPVPQLEHFD